MGALKVAVAGALLLTASACEYRRAEVTYSLVNATDRTVYETGISIGKEYTAPHGTLVPDAPSGVLMDMIIGSENEVVVVWKDDQGQEYSSSTTVTREELIRDRGVSFTIQADGTISHDFHIPEGF